MTALLQAHYLDRFTSPGPLAVDQGGNVYFKDSNGGGQIEKLTPAGVLTAFAGVPPNTPSAARWDLKSPPRKPISATSPG